jgi:diguanylate cyclase (GGDEF)-like protein/PAS domain S-box-containing protein
LSGLIDPFGAYLDILFEGACVTDADQKIVTFNKGAERISGFRRSEVMGLKCGEEILIQIDAFGRVLRGEESLLTTAMKDGRMSESQVFLLHRNGQRVPVSTRVAPLWGSAGSIVGAVEFFEDSSPGNIHLQRVRALEGMAYKDQLTGLGNRRYFELQISVSFEEFRHYGWQFGLMMIDIDHFKQVNDKHGHRIGDRVLKFVAETLVRTSRDFDVVCRWGGEEFIVVVAQIDPAILESIAERARLAIEATSLPLKKGVDISTTVSIGATMGVKGDTPETLIERVDGLMYRSKQEGRNRVTVG